MMEVFSRKMYGEKRGKEGERVDDDVEVDKGVTWTFFFLEIGRASCRERV